MAEDQGKPEEGKFDFTREGEAVGYVSLDQARILAMRTAREAPGDYGRRFRNVAMAFEVLQADETEDFYQVTLSFRPQGQFTGTQGQEQFFIEKEGNVAVRQVLALRRLAGVRRLPVVPVAIGLVAVVIAVGVGVVFAVGGGGGGGDDGVLGAAVLPTSLPPPGNTAISPAGATPASAQADSTAARATPANSQADSTVVKTTATTAPRPTEVTTLPRPGTVPSPTEIAATGLSRGGTISGVVTDAETGRPIPGIDIQARNIAQDEPRYTGRSDGAGIYILTGIPPGIYRLRLNSGSGDYIPEAYKDKLDWDAADIVIVRGPEAVEGIDFALKRGAKISGTVTDAATGLPISNIRLNAGPVAWEWMTTTETDGNGNFTIRGLPDGLTRVAVTDDRFEFVSQRRTVTVIGRETVTGFDLALVQGSTISGRVTNVNTGLPIANQRVDAENVRRDYGPRTNARTDSDGRYKLLGIAPGTYSIRLCCPSLDYIREFYDEKLTREGADLITIQGIEAVEGIDFTLKQGATISGTVRDGQTGLGIPRMSVRAGLSAFPYLSDTHTDRDGAYTLRGVPDGTIVVVVEGQGYVRQEKIAMVTNGEDIEGFDF